MPYLLCCLVVFLTTYTLNTVYVSVFYHRGLAHRSIELHPWLERFVIATGSWVTGLDPKGWVCMHRMHHKYSDTARDPHSPVTKGIWSVLFQQLHSYKKTLAGLIHGKRAYTSMVEDLDCPVNWLNRRQIWYLPYVAHGVFAVLIGVIFHAWLLAAFYWVGMMSHPIQGWMVNALAHRFGYRNYDIPDNSRNNHIVAWLVFGEGYQNNHHFKPQSANFSARGFEIDFGFVACRALSLLGLLKLAPTEEGP